MKNGIGFVIKVGLFLGLIVPMFAKDGKINKLIEDDTLKRYERKAILFTKDVALETRKVSFPVTYCYPVKKKTNCVNEGVYEYKINENIEDKIEKLSYELVVGNRFDKILVEKAKGITMILPTGTTKIKNKNIPSFSYDTGAYKNYKSSVDKFLSKLYKPMKSILIETKDARYKQMKNKEKESFYVKKAKSSGLPVEFLTKIMNSSFVFSSYIPEVSGGITINKIITKKKVKGLVVYITTYSTSLSVSLNQKLSTYKLNADNPAKGFTFHKEFTGPQGGSSSQSFKSKPNKEQIRQLFEPAVLSASRSSAKNLSYELVKDDNFAIFAPVNSVSNNMVKASIGKLEDLKVDAPYIIRKTVNSQVKETGFVKTRIVFDNMYKENEKTKKKVQPIGESSFQVIQGSANIVSLMREHPWSGNFMFGGISLEKFHLDKIAGLDAVGNGNFPSITVGHSSDLGFTSNKASLSEVWMDFKFSTGISDDITIGNSLNMKTPILIAASGSMSKRFYISTIGLYIAPKVGLGYSMITGSIESSFSLSPDKLLVHSYDATVGVDTGYNMGPNQEIVFSVAYDVSLGNSKAKFTESDTEFEAEVSRGVSFYLGYKQHITKF